jgi:hypothetical protein
VQRSTTITSMADINEQAREDSGRSIFCKKQADDNDDRN